MLNKTSKIGGMYNEIANKEKKMIIKRGKKILKNMGL